MTEPATNWIAVEDRKPPELTSVLLLFEPGGYYRARAMVGHLFDGEWGPAAARRFKITHWMPIPPPPDGLRIGPYGS